MTDESLHQDGIGGSDSLDRLWTPYRMAYIRGENKPVDGTEGECPFCRIPSLDDAAGLVVRRGETAYVVLNLYPYTAGHLMICPYRHFADYTDTTDEELVEIGALTKRAFSVLRPVQPWLTLAEPCEATDHGAAWMNSPEFVTRMAYWTSLMS